MEKADQLEIKNPGDLEKLSEELTKEAKEIEEAKKLEQKERGTFLLRISLGLLLFHKGKSALLRRLV